MNCITPLNKMYNNVRFIFPIFYNFKVFFSLMRATNERLSLLSEEEQFALYGLPDFDDVQRQEFLTFHSEEQDIFYSRPSISSQIYCALQLGYFKAKQLFFDFTWKEIPPEDWKFILENYFPDHKLMKYDVSRHEFYLQRTSIMQYFKYSNWNNKKHQKILVDKLESLVKIDTLTVFLLPEIITFLKVEKIIRPGYSTLQKLISSTLANERERISKYLLTNISEDMQKQLDILISTDSMISDLAALKQDAKNFKYRMMQLECSKLEKLRPLYQLAKSILPQLLISQQNINYYASLAHFYQVHQLRQFKPEQRNLYILCYALQRYQKIMDNLAEAFFYNIKHFDDNITLLLKNHKLGTYKKQKKYAKKVGKLLGLFIDETIDDKDLYGKVRKKAYKILPKEQINNLVNEFAQLTKSEQELRWKIYDKVGYKFRKNLRPIFMQLALSSSDTNDGG